MQPGLEIKIQAARKVQPVPTTNKNSWTIWRNEANLGKEAGIISCVFPWQIDHSFTRILPCVVSKSNRRRQNLSLRFADIVIRLRVVGCYKRIIVLALAGAEVD